MTQHSIQSTVSGGLASAGAWKNKLAAAAGGKAITRNTGAGAIARSRSVILLLDASNSMAGDGIQQAKSGAVNFIREILPQGYQVGMVSFSGWASERCPLTTDYAKITAAIRALSCDGGTNITDALRTGARLLSTVSGARVLYLLTDGEPFEPDTQALALSAAADIKKSGVKIMTHGVTGADQYFLNQLAGGADGERLALPVSTPRTLSLDMGAAAKLLLSLPNK